MTIRAAHYDETVSTLMTESIVQNMWLGLLSQYGTAAAALAAVTHDDGEPTWEFMSAATAEYARRGGETDRHIGGVAEALIRMLNLMIAQLPDAR